MTALIGGDQGRWCSAEKKTMRLPRSKTSNEGRGEDGEDASSPE